MNKKRIVFDFDGVIHKYSKGWQDGSIYDEPVEGIKEVIDQLRQKYEVVIVSTRSKELKGRVEMLKWLDKYNIIVDQILVSKPLAMIYIDDRGYKFDGNALHTLVWDIEHFKTWQEEEENA